MERKITVKQVKPKETPKVKEEEAQATLNPEVEHILKITVHDSSAKPSPQDMELNALEKKALQLIIDRLECDKR